MIRAFARSVGDSTRRSAFCDGRAERNAGSPGGRVDSSAWVAASACHDSILPRLA